MTRPALCRLLAGLLLLTLASAGAQAQIINIDSRYGFTYDGGGSDPAPQPGQHINIIGTPVVTLTLDAGQYTITNAAGLPGALHSAWSYNVGTSSWAWAFVMADDATRQVKLYAEAGGGSSAAQVAALPAVQNFNTSFSLASTTTLAFTLRDYYVPDNAGGVSLKIAPLAAVPEPASLLTMALGLGALLWRRRAVQLQPGS